MCAGRFRVAGDEDVVTRFAIKLGSAFNGEWQRVVIHFAIKEQAASQRFAELLAQGWDTASGLGTWNLRL